MYLCNPKRTWCPEFSWLERQIVVLNVVGSNPTGHPEETDMSVSFFISYPSLL